MSVAELEHAFHELSEDEQRQLIQRILEEWEDKLDAQAVEEAKKENDYTDYMEFRKELKKP